MKYYVYWYYLKEVHNNPYNEGYIGVTNNLDRRHKEHKTGANDKSNNLHIYNAIRKYGWDAIDKKVLHELHTYEEASELEYMYRSEINIGWNSAIGGYLNIGESNKTPITLYHKDNYEVDLKFNSIEEASKQLDISRGRIIAAKLRERSVYGLDGYAVLFDKDFDKSKTKTIKELLSESLIGIKRDKPSHFKGMTNRWSEEDKIRISSQHKGKVISEEAKQISREKNRLGNPACRKIVLHHKDNIEKKYEYHSISEASRQLQIPLSRLKSKVRAPLERFGKDGWAVISLGSD